MIKKLNYKSSSRFFIHNDIYMSLFPWGGFLSLIEINMVDRHPVDIDLIEIKFKRNGYNFVKMLTYSYN